MAEADILAFADDRIAIGRAAISEAAPAGENMRGDAVFEALESEVRKLDSAGPSGVDWQQVSEGGLALLRDRSKDLLVAVWVVFALLQREGLSGFATGASLTAGMIDAHWDAMAPPKARERARVSALEWLVGRAVPILASYDLREDHWPAALAAYDAVLDIDRLASERLAKEQISLGELIRALRPLRDSARRGFEEQRKIAAEAAARAPTSAQDAAGPERSGAAIADAEQTPRTTQHSAAAPSPTVSQAVPVTAPAPDAGDSSHSSSGGFPAAPEPETVLARLPEWLRDLAQRLREKTPTDPRVVLLARAASWLRIRQLPPHQGIRSGVPAPTADIARLQELRDAKNHTEALALCETLAWTAPFWLDGHRIAAEILRELGGDGPAASDTIAGLLGMLVRRFPELGDITFSDGRPFMDAATKEWVGQAGNHVSGAGADDEINAALSDARGAAASGRVLEAADMLTTLARTSASGRLRMRAQIAQIEFGLESGLISAILPVLDHLERQVNDRHLEEWEPALALRVGELQFRALTHPDTVRVMPEDRRRAALDLARSRIARLDLATAARLFR